MSVINATYRAPWARRKSECLRTDGFDAIISVENQVSTENNIISGPGLKYYFIATC